MSCKSNDENVLVFFLAINVGISIFSNLFQGQYNDLVIEQKQNVVIVALCSLTDINECTEQPTVCRANQECRNTIGSYRCRNLVSCGPGFELDPSGSTCIGVWLFSTYSRQLKFSKYGMGTGDMAEYYHIQWVELDIKGVTSTWLVAIFLLN